VINTTAFAQVSDEDALCTWLY